MLSDAVGWEASSMALGPTPVDAAIVRCQEIRAILSGDPWAEGLALEPLASLHAMRGEFAIAFELLEESSAALAGCGPTVDAAVSHPEAFVAMLAGDLERAERVLRTGCRVLEQMGERAVLASTEGYLAQVLLVMGRDRDADRLARRCAALATDDDASPQVIWRQVRARVLARRGHAQRAVELAREAVKIAMTTDHLNIQADALVDLAIVQDAAGVADEAETALATAVRIFETKGNVVRAREGGRLPTRPTSV
jgi:tetratricopeptide (TPR) repeat protein